MSRPSISGVFCWFREAARDLFIALFDTNRPTREALRDIARLLHEAGWDEPAPRPLTTDQLEHLRDASARLLQPDDLKVIQAVVADRRPLAEIAAEFNRSPDELNRQLAQTLANLAAFTREAQSTPA